MTAERSGPAAVLDRVHLDRQALGDAALAGEVLRLFRDQLGPQARTVEADASAMRAEIAHRLKGAAFNIGAFDLAEAAARLEAAPQDDAAARAVAASAAALLAAIEATLATA